VSWLTDLWEWLQGWLSQHYLIVVVVLFLLVLLLLPVPEKRGEVGPDGRRPLRPLTRRSILGFLALGAGVTIGTFEWLLSGSGIGTVTSPDEAQLWMDAVKTALTAGIGASGLLALYVSLRRQMVSERDHLLQSQVAANNQLDASEKRVTELYGRAVDQLAKDNAASRFAALYALERLAQANPAHRQTIVDLICGYLRIRSEFAGPDAPPDAQANLVPDRNEVEVRATAQKILKAHLSRDDALDQAERFWDIRLDLHGARLEDFSLRECKLGDVDFHGAEFVGKADFGSSRFEGEVNFDGAIFRDTANFGAAKFHKYASFDDVEFCERADFERSEFDNGGTFQESTFRQRFIAIGMRADLVNFNNSEFFGDALVRAASFSNSALFEYCTFHSFVQLTNTKADWKVKMSFCKFYGFTDLSDTEGTFELYRSQIIKNDENRYCRPPKGWYIKDVSEDVAIFGSHEMDELEKEREERKRLEANAAENGSAKAEAEDGHKDNGEVTPAAEDEATQADQSHSGGAAD
jgi:uncharacterized protein YjbI with pentapeptide repeats